MAMRFSMGRRRLSARVFHPSLVLGCPFLGGAVCAIEVWHFADESAHVRCSRHRRIRERCAWVGKQEVCADEVVREGRRGCLPLSVRATSALAQTMSESFSSGKNV